MSQPVLIAERRDDVLVLRLNRPDARNAITAAMLGLLGQHLAEAEADPTLRCVVLTGTGDRAFCSGMDLRGFRDEAMTDDEVDAILAGFHRFVRGDIAIPVIGAANATAVAGGFELLLACDIVVASTSARFGLPEVQRGLLAAGGGVFIATRIPLALALELTLTGELIDAQRAHALGLVNHVVPADQVLDRALAVAARIAANGPLAVRATRSLVRAAVTDVTAAWASQEEWQARVFGSDDAREGALAFVEKRDPVWTGR